jgi:hypothetical protein
MFSLSEVHCFEDVFNLKRHDFGQPLSLSHEWMRWWFNSQELVPMPDALLLTAQGRGDCATSLIE